MASGSPSARSCRRTPRCCWASPHPPTPSPSRCCCRPRLGSVRTAARGSRRPGCRAGSCAGARRSAWATECDGGEREAQALGWRWGC
eukprot:1037442-Pyramimonas_sp.AAC.1